MIDAARLLASAGAHRDPASDAAVAHAQRHLHQDAGRREAQRLLAAVLECLPDQTGARTAHQAPQQEDAQRWATLT